MCSSDLSVCPRMAELSGAGEGVGVIEVGPGIGVLTTELCSLAVVLLFASQTWATRPHLGSIFEKLLHRKTF